MSIFRFIKNSLSNVKKGRTETQTETTEQIIKALHRLDSKNARYLAGFAYILARVAHADLHISTEESREMERIVTQQGKLPKEQAAIVVDMVKTQNVLFGGTESFLVTREFSELASLEQKKSLLHCLFAVSSSDNTIDTVEDNEIRKISKEIGLKHTDFISARSAFRQHLSVLQQSSEHT